jgi:hypothetical protein
MELCNLCNTEKENCITCKDNTICPYCKELHREAVHKVEKAAARQLLKKLN